MTLSTDAESEIRSIKSELCFLFVIVITLIYYLSSLYDKWWIIVAFNLYHELNVEVKKLGFSSSFWNFKCIFFYCRIVVALAKDLQKEFYPYYLQFLEVLIELLNTKDAEQLDWTFTCLAHLFKFLWRPLVKDINVVFNSLLPLLSDTKPDYINSFAAESFAFVARKVKDKKAFLSLLLKAVKTKQDVSFLLFIKY